MDAELATICKVVTPESEDWKAHLQRWNHFNSDTKVRIVALPKDIAEVVAIANWATKHKQTDIGVRSGGHGFFSSAEVVVDMRHGFDYASVDEKGVATIGMGQTLKSVDERTAPWHVPVGVVSHTGCGLLLTGGVGYQTKAHGTSADNILEITIVTSDGEVHVCSKDNEPDLFFAARGAAPNLGVVTEVKAQCYKIPDATCRLSIWPLTEENVQRLIDFCDQDAVLNDPTITTYVAMIPSPDKQPICAIHVVCIGPKEQDEKYNKIIAQLDDTGNTDLLPTSRVPFTTPQTIFDASFPEQYWYVSQTYFPGNVTVPKECIKETTKAFFQVPLEDTHAMLIFEQRGSNTSGYHKHSSDSCAQPRHGQRWEAYIFYGTTDKDKAEAARQQGREMRDVVTKFGKHGGRVHFTKDEPSRVDFYYGENTPRVREVQAKYDSSRTFATCNGMAF